MPRPFPLTVGFFAALLGVSIAGAQGLGEAEEPAGFVEIMDQAYRSAQRPPHKRAFRSFATAGGRVSRDEHENTYVYREVEPTVVGDSFFGDTDNLGSEIIFVGTLSMSFGVPEPSYQNLIYDTLNSSPNTGVIYGPIYGVTNYGTEDETLDPSQSEAPLIADDLNGNGSTFHVITADLNGDGTIDDDEFIGTFIDYGDLHTFDVFFDEVSVRHQLQTNSFELTKQHVLHADPGVNTRKSGWRFDAYFDDWRVGFGDEVVAMKSTRLRYLRDNLSQPFLQEFFNDLRTTTYVSAGLRANDFRSEFAWAGTGSILGRTGAAVENDHLFFGPQLGIGAVAESSFWRFEALLLGAIGYQRTDYELNGVFGHGAVPGGLNNAINIRSTNTSITGVSEDDFGWHAETRLGASCQLSQHWRFDASWRWFIAGRITTV